MSALRNKRSHDMSLKTEKDIYEELFVFKIKKLSKMIEEGFCCVICKSTRPTVITFTKIKSEELTKQYKENELEDLKIRFDGLFFICPDCLPTLQDHIPDAVIQTIEDRINAFLPYKQNEQTVEYLKNQLIEGNIV